MKGVYQITNKINGKKYIGSSSNVFKRWEQHVPDLHYGLHHSHLLQKDWKKYSLNDFTFEVLEYVEDKKDLLKIEQMWIDGEDVSTLYNVMLDTSLKRKSAPVDFLNSVFFSDRMDEEIKNKLIKNLNIHEKEGNLSKYGNGKYDYSKLWFNKNSEGVKRLRLNINNYFTNQIKTVHNDRAWTTFTQQYKRLSYVGNIKSFVPLTDKLEEDDRRNTLCFAANCFLNPFLKRKYEELKDLTEETYALSVLLKWIVDVSNINKPIHIYVASKRMEDILKGWIKHNKKESRYSES
ncbi:GIY-YIG nuclease family protein [Bacillus licheniformis]|uniref:GIY-YIG nuclease family protein n=1 Tax=Bacillus licheniformis TaxID=1402 RepID=UPI002E2F08FD|nr:GIY-YIG nuclease family protein [Bacillus licheniformis]MED7755560.1 GIY-YIG nuclease family protein [Bacillus licheniformis]